MHDESSDAERQVCQHERWERAITISILAVIASGILGFAAHDAFFAKTSRRSNPIWVCIANLEAIDGAKCTWALENQKTNSDVPTDAEIFGVTSYIREKPVCPSSGTYRLRAVNKKPHCSIPGHTL